MKWFGQKKQEDAPNYSKKLIEIEDALALHSRELKELRESLEKLEIKALESRKVYHKKLKNLLEEEESSKEEEEGEAKGINNTVLLPENGIIKRR